MIYNYFCFKIKILKKVTGKILMIENEHEIMQMQIYNDMGDFNEEKIEKYMDSPEWIELDDLFEKITSENEDYESLLLDILAYGEISRLKFNQFLSNIHDEMILTTELFYIPIFLDMPYEVAVNVITDWNSNDEEKRKISCEIVSDYQRDSHIEFLIETTRNALNDNNSKLAEESLKELYDMGGYILPRIRLALSIHETCYTFLRNITTIIMLLTLGEEKTVELIPKIYNENEKIQILAREEVKNAIIEIDTSPYFDRHPDKFHELNKSTLWGEC